jgi:hypothetical protein
MVNAGRLRGGYRNMPTVSSDNNKRRTKQMGTATAKTSVKVCELCGKFPPRHEGMKLCSTCLGLPEGGEADPVYEGMTNYDPAAEAKAREEEKKAPKRGACRACGKTPDETPFYPSRKDRCKECIKAENRAKSVGSAKYEPIMEPDGLVIPKPAPAERCTCETCGADFESYKRGSVWIRTKCENCANDTLRRVTCPSKETVVLDMREEPELLAALGESARKARRDRNNQALYLLESLLMGGQP